MSISVCAVRPNSGSPLVELMVTCRLAEGSEPSAPCGRVTVKLALVWPAGTTTKPDGRVPPKAEAGRSVASGAVTAQAMTVSVPDALVR